MNKFQTLEEAQEAWEKILVLIIPAAVDIAVLDGGKPLRERMHDFIVSVWHSAYQAGVEKCVEAVAEETKGEYWPAQFDERFSEEKYKLENKKEALHADAEIKLWIMELLILKEIAMLEKLEALRK